jgi:hypothetical protein
MMVVVIFPASSKVKNANSPENARNDSDLDGSRCRCDVMYVRPGHDVQEPMRAAVHTGMGIVIRPQPWRQARTLNARKKRGQVDHLHR